MSPKDLCFIYVMTIYLYSSAYNSVMYLRLTLTQYIDTKTVFTQRSLSDLTLYQSKVRSDKVCVNTLNRIGKPDR